MNPRGTAVIDGLHRDDGCEVAPSCLRCPLPQCKYDDPTVYHLWLQESRDRKVIQVKRAENLTLAQLAQHFEVSERTIQRILARAR